MNEAQQHIIALLQGTASAGARARLESLSAAMWGRVLEEAERLGVAPVLLGRAESLQLSLSPDVQASLRAILDTHTARNIRLLSEFDQLAKELGERGVQFLPVKGVHLCTSLYENIGERPIWDIDLLVRLEKLRDALSAIEAAGYRPRRPFDLDLEVRSYHHVPAHVKRGAPPVEVHWTLLNPRFQNGLNWQELWGRSIVERVGETETRVLSPADSLVYLCAHVAYQHIYIDALRSLYDIKLLVQKRGADLDWGAITARARSWGLANSVYLSLRLTDVLLGCEVPVTAWPVLRPPEFGDELLEAAERRVLEHSARSPVVSAVWARRSALHRLKGLWGRLMVPRAVLAGRYRLAPNSRKLPFYYFVRAWDLLRAHGQDLLDLVFGRRRRAWTKSESELIAYLRWWR